MIFRKRKARVGNLGRETTRSGGSLCDEPPEWWNRKRGSHETGEGERERLYVLPLSRATAASLDQGRCRGDVTILSSRARRLVGQLGGFGGSIPEFVQILRMISSRRAVFRSPVFTFQKLVDRWRGLPSTKNGTRLERSEGEPRARTRMTRSI